MPEQEQEQKQQTVSFPAVSVMIANDGIVIETFFSTNISFKQGIAEQQVNELMKLWVENRKQLQKQQKLVADVMRTKL